MSKLTVIVLYIVLKTRFITVIVIQVVVFSKIVFEINMLGSIGDIQLQNGYFMICIFVQIIFPENLFDFSSFVVPCTHCIWIQEKKKYLYSSCIRIRELESETWKKNLTCQVIQIRGLNCFFMPFNWIYGFIVPMYGINTNLEYGFKSEI